MEKPDWLKTKGYLHITPSLSVENDWKKYYALIADKKFIEKYAFYPLMYNEIKERKYKKIDQSEHKNNPKTGRTHRFINKDGSFKQTAKKRPIHYASHFDALIYAYYSSILSERYEVILKKDKYLDESIIAYRKIKLLNSDKGKGTIHFAKEAFDEIKNRAERENTAALTFDIENFFSGLDHLLLKQKWCEVLNEKELPKHHYKVFKACTKFRYVHRDELRINKSKRGRRSGFDEKKLSEIRRKKGYKSFFYDNQDFRNAIKNKEITVYKNSFYKTLGNGKKVNMGIPQGLPISATLANIYLLDFDQFIINELVKKKNVYYRRYSDDILIICKQDEVDFIKKSIISKIEESFLKISESKTEQFIFKNLSFNKKQETRLTSIKLDNTKEKINKPLIYLGFEFRGYNTTIKSTNLAKYYRRIISVVKRRAKRAKYLEQNNPFSKKAIFKNQIKKLYNSPLDNIDSETNEIKQKFRSRSKFYLKNNGEFNLELYQLPIKNQSNYISYLRRCDKIFKNPKDKSFLKQVRKRHHIVNSAIKKHLNL
ncbi:reverse transcriptase domain-containing protein [Empedobacter falsenii]|uniref:reverse transcriptase domain-containing protein n=1 Tax=Empedobacter sp. 189-2 TaxID=2746724 RepID=UPI00257774AB|nr:reverse transcriptase domain-containing protein [Empedobacter sp. 189-2]MDM1543652.1 hypothetical protein [Empedobacter sp. 189-2]